MADPQPASALFTDLYQLTMAQAYWQSGTTAPATFSLYFRDYPPDRSYFVLAGVYDALRYLERFHFTEGEIDYLRSLDTFDGGFLEFLAGLRFTGSVRAMGEGSIFFAGEPVFEVSAPIIQAQVAETLILNQVSLQTTLATKAARVVHAAGGRTVVDFAARRTHGTEAALHLARASYMAGFDGTSNVAAGRLHGIPLYGTMAHSFVEAFDTEEAALKAYAASFPDSSTFLVDTYDTLGGVKKAAALARETKRQGHPLRAIRLDSGDLLELAKASRSILDGAGLSDVRIFASGGLDEFEIERLLGVGAPIDGFGVGTKLGVSADAPWSDCVYKLVEYDGRPTMKLSAEKETAPGRKQVHRTRGASGRLSRDLVSLVGEPAPDTEAEPLLHDIMRDGATVGPPEDLAALRARFAVEFARLPAEYKALSAPGRYPVAFSAALSSLRDSAAAAIRRRELTVC